METAEIRDLISAFVPEEILRDFELKEVKKECGVYRLYMDEKDDESHYPPELAEAKEVVRCGYMNPCEIQTFPIAGLRGFHLHTPPLVEGEGWSRVLFQHL